jgi:hypothetical protein
MTVMAVKAAAQIGRSDWSKRAATVLVNDCGRGKEKFGCDDPKAEVPIWKQDTVSTARFG